MKPTSYWTKETFSVSCRLGFHILWRSFRNLQLSIKLPLTYYDAFLWWMCNVTKDGIYAFWNSFFLTSGKIRCAEPMNLKIDIVGRTNVPAELTILNERSRNWLCQKGNTCVSVTQAHSTKTTRKTFIKNHLSSPRFHCWCLSKKN